MRILVTEHNQTTDGVATYIESLTKVLEENGHYVSENKNGDFDIVFAKRQDNYKAPTIIHDHNAIIPSIKYCDI